VEQDEVLMKRIVLFLLLLIALPAAAQDDTPRIEPLGIGMWVEETISDRAPFDWWQIDAGVGDEIAVEIEAYEGLAPILGILSPGGDLLTRSADGAPNGTLRLQFVFPADGSYTIVAGRVGLNDGATTGRYRLRVERIGAPPAPIDPMFQEVTFPCATYGDAAAVATLSFRQERLEHERYAITVLGFDGFTPVIRFQSSERGTDDCTPPDDDDLAVAYTLPDGTRGASSVGTAAQLVINTGGVDLGEMTIKIGGLDGAPGRYLALIEGFAIETGTDMDVISARLGALPAEGAPLDVYMVGGNNRLDPVVIVDDVQCDDAGRRGCANVPAISGAGIGMLSADRFDAGVRLTDTLPRTLTLASFAQRTSGAYAVLLVGELPPRTFDD
jgi:hypothetical protein